MPRYTSNATYHLDGGHSFTGPVTINSDSPESASEDHYNKVVQRGSRRTQIDTQQGDVMTLGMSIIAISYGQWTLVP